MFDLESDFLSLPCGVPMRCHAKWIDSEDGKDIEIFVKLSLTHVNRAGVNYVLGTLSSFRLSTYSFPGLDKNAGAIAIFPVTTTYSENGRITGAPVLVTGRKDGIFVVLDSNGKSVGGHGYSVRMDAVFGMMTALMNLPDMSEEERSNIAAKIERCRKEHDRALALSKRDDTHLHYVGPSQVLMKLPSGHSLEQRISVPWTTCDPYDAIVRICTSNRWDDDIIVKKGGSGWSVCRPRGTTRHIAWLPTFGRAVLKAIREQAKRLELSGHEKMEWAEAHIQARAIFGRAKIPEDVIAYI